MKSKTRNRSAARRLVPVLVGAALYVLLGLLAAHLILAGMLPEDLSEPVMFIALAISSVAAGSVSGGGKRALLTGALLALLYLLGKLALESGDFFTLHTLIGLACTLLGAWLGSCIFHKKAKPYTNRNRKNRARNYK